jgi:hypothetical protein
MMAKGLPRKALIAITSYHGVIYPDGTRTGLFFTEALHPFEVLTRAGFGAVAMCVGICWRGLRWDEDTGSGSQVNRLFSKVLV